MKRVSIRKRILLTILLLTILSLTALIITSVICMIKIRHEEEKTLLQEMDEDFTRIVANRAEVADARLEHFERYIEFITDYTENMYRDREKMIDRGHLFYAPVDTHEYMLTSGYVSEDMKPEDFREELLFFSNLESVLEPIAKENDGLISTIYLGTKSGLLVSYDKYSYLSVPEEGKEMVYNFYDSVWYKQSQKEDGIFYSGLYTDSQGRGLTVTIGSAFHDDKGEYQGAVCADFDITALHDEMISLDLGEGAFSFALDRDRNIISPDASDASNEKYAALDDAALDIITSGGTGILEKDDAFYIYSPVKKIGWTFCSCVPRNIVMENLDQVDRSISIAWLVFSLVVIFVLIAVVVASRLIAKSVTYPIERISSDMEIIAGGDLEHKSVAVRNDEIGDMSFRLNEMVERLQSTMENLFLSQKYAEKMSELANKDALTGVRNRTAYDNQIRLLNEELAAGQTGFGIAMADLNNLKAVNDGYGHAKGNEAIRKCCSVICDVFDHSPVFRVGGDEFVVILKGSDYEHCDELVEEFYRRTDAMKTDDSLQPWEKVTASIAYAKYDAKLDKSADDVAVRADQAMYDRKKVMKAAE